MGSKSISKLNILIILSILPKKIFVTKLDKVTNYKDNAYLSEKGTWYKIKIKKLLKYISLSYISYF